MSSMIKKKGTLSFKPKAPQSRRQPRAPPSAPSSSRQSIERQSQTPAPPIRPSASSPPFAPTQLQDAIHEPSPLYDPPVEEIPVVLSTQQVEGLREIVENPLSRSCPDAPAARDNDATTSGEPPTSASSLTISITSESPISDLPTADHHVVEPTGARNIGTQDPATSRQTQISDSGFRDSDQTPVPLPNVEPVPPAASIVLAASKAQKKSRRPSKRRKVDENNAEIRPTIEVQLSKPGRRGPRGLRKPRDKEGESRKRKRREATPPDAEEQELDHTTVKMADLTKDLRVGKKFSRHSEIKKREIERKAKARLTRDHLGLDGDQTNGDEASMVVARQEDGPGEITSGPQMRIVNGQIVIDDASLVVDRHAMAAAAAPDMEEVEEDDFTRITTSGTFMKRERSMAWDFEALEKLYSALRMFGTDFEMIAKMFPDRTRRQIKLKFNKEEREHPRKISSALIGEVVKMDFEEYKTHTGLVYEEVAVIEAEYARMEEEHHAEQQRLQAEADESTRQKKAEIHNTAGGTNPSAGPSTTPGTTPAAGTDSAKENEPDRGGAAEGGKASAASKSKKKSAAKKKKRNLHSVRGGGRGG